MSPHTLNSKFHTVILHLETYFISTVPVRVCLLCLSSKFRMPVPNGSLITFIKSKGQEKSPHGCHIQHKFTLTNVTFSFNSVTIMKVKVKVHRLRYPGFHSTGYLVYLANTVCRFLSTNLSHRTDQLSKRLRPRCRMEVALPLQNCQDTHFPSVAIGTPLWYRVILNPS
jgi:hypothetical protein